MHVYLLYLGRGARLRCVQNQDLPPANIVRDMPGGAARGSGIGLGKVAIAAHCELHLDLMLYHQLYQPHNSG